MVSKPKLFFHLNTSSCNNILQLKLYFANNFIFFIIKLTEEKPRIVISCLDVLKVLFNPFEKLLLFSR